METKPQKLKKDILIIGIVTMVVVTILSNLFLYRLEPKHFGNLFLAIPIGLGALYNINKIYNVSYLKGIVLVILMYGNFYLFFYVLKGGGYTAGLSLILINIPLCVLLFILISKFLFKIRMNKNLLLNLLWYILGVFVIILFVNVFSDIQNELLLFYLLVTFIMVIIYPLSIMKK